MEALGDLRCEASKKFLLKYLALDRAEASTLGSPRYEYAAVSVMQQYLTLDELKALCERPTPTVRGIAVPPCLDHPLKERTAVLKTVSPWVLDLPGAKR